MCLVGGALGPTTPGGCGATAQVSPALYQKASGRAQLGPCFSY
jgi:hypothetical protein